MSTLAEVVSKSNGCRMHPDYRGYEIAEHIERGYFWAEQGLDASPTFATLDEVKAWIDTPAGQTVQPETESTSGSEPKITPLADGERRLLRVVDGSDGMQHRAYLIRRRPSDPDGWKFVVVVHSAEDTTFDFDTELPWTGGGDEREVYIRLAEATALWLSVPEASASCSYWLEPGVQWFADRVR